MNTVVERARSLWARMETAGAAHPISVDSSIAVLLTLVAEAELWDVVIHFPTSWREPHLLDSIGVLFITLPLTFRRRSPIWAAGASGLGVLAGFLLRLQTPYLAFFALPLAVYTAASLTNVRRSIPIAAGVLLCAAPRLFQGQYRTDYASLIVLIGSWFIGDSSRRRRELMEERAIMLAKEREERARKAAADERLAIARDLHDVLAHSVSLMVVQAGGARFGAESDPQIAHQALRDIENIGRQALVEMRRLLGVLRHEDHEHTLHPRPSLSQVDRLVEQVSSAGLPVSIRIEGEPVELEPGLDVSAYRVIQEALTNSLKHAGKARASVTIRFCADELELEVTDDGTGSGAGLNGARRGLIGLRERVALFGGEFEAEPLRGSGFRVRARLPLTREPQ